MQISTNTRLTTSSSSHHIRKYTKMETPSTNVYEGYPLTNPYDQSVQDPKNRIAQVFTKGVAIPDKKELPVSEKTAFAKVGVPTYVIPPKEKKLTLKSFVEKRVETAEHLIKLFGGEVQVSIDDSGDSVYIRGFGGRIGTEAVSRKVTEVVGKTGSSLVESQNKEFLGDLLLGKVFGPLALKIDKLKGADKCFYYSMNSWWRSQQFPEGGEVGLGVLSHADCVFPLHPKYKLMAQAFVSEKKQERCAEIPTKEIQIPGKGLEKTFHLTSPDTVTVVDV